MGTILVYLVQKDASHLQTATKTIHNPLPNLS